jgi:hypothetical protein
LSFEPIAQTGSLLAKLPFGLLEEKLLGAFIDFNGGRDIVIFEIRNYHFRPDLIEAYKVWAKAEAIPHLAQQLEVVGFWINTNDAPEIDAAPQDKFGSGNVTWIIRWRDLAHRNDILPRVLSSPTWQDIFSRVPGGESSYLRVEAKFAESLV